MNKTLNFRNEMKAKKPDFERQDANKYKQFRGKWRRPRGIHNKLRRGFKGHKAMPSIGYSSPRSVSGLTRKGLSLILVHNKNDLNKVKENCVGVIAGNVGLKKKIEILNLAKEKKVNILGVKDIESFVSSAKEKLAKRKKDSESKKEKNNKKEEKTSEEKKKDESQK